MKFRSLLPLLVLACAASLQAAEEAPPATPKPGLMHRLLHPFGGGTPKGADGKAVTFKNLEMKLGVEPAVVKLADTREIKVTVTLANQGKKLVQLDFPTTQRIEVLIKNQAGKRIVQWSEDQAFTNDPTLVAINPGERLEYPVTLSTRDLVAGETFTIEAFFPNFDPLRKTRTVTPEK